MKKKFTSDEKVISMLVRFTEIKRTLKILIEEEEFLKKNVKTIMHDYGTNVLVAGDYAALLTNRERKDLDKEILFELLGENLDHAFKKTSYEIFEVKKA